MPRPTPHGRKAAKTPGFAPKKNRWSNEKREAMGKAPRKQWEPREQREARFRGDDRDARAGVRDERAGRRDDRDERRGYRNDRDERGGRDERRSYDGPRTADGRGRNFEQVRPERRGYSSSDAPREGGFAGRAPRPVNRDERGDRWDGDRRGSRYEDRGSRFGRDDRRDRRDDRHQERFDDRRQDRFEDRGRDRLQDRDRRDGRDRFGRDDRPQGRDDRPRKDFHASRPQHTEPRPKWEPRADRKPWDRPERKEERRRVEHDDRRQGGIPRDERSWRDERGDRGPRRDDRPRFEREAHRHEPREDRPVEENLDQMSWTATDLGEIDDSQVHADEGFAALGVPSIMVAALDKQGITTPFPIQSATIPDAIAGRDVLGRGQTGSGKTLGFGLPMLTRIAEADTTGGAPRGLVLVPTRELALQCADVLAPLAKTLKLDLTLIAGGMGYGPQLRAFERGVDVVVATPGRLIDLLEQGAVDLSQVLVTVLDEADHMADLGFMPAVTTLLDTVPADGQRLLFSATLDHAVDRIVKKYLHDPVTHEVDTDRASVTTMEHYLLMVPPHEKNGITAEVANREGRTVLFARTQMGATRIATQLREAGVMAGALHGGLTQGARTRILAAFKDGTVPVLVATDVAARGIHVDDVTLVLEVDPPMNSKDYLHRAGRTARAGTKGVVASICLPHQRRSMLRLLQQAGVKATQLETHPGQDDLVEATGARPADGLPIEEAEYERLIAPKKPVRGPRQGGGRGAWGRGGNRGQGGGYRGQGGRRFGGDRDRGGRGGNEGWRRER